jgi:hypothetical protein
MYFHARLQPIVVQGGTESFSTGNANIPLGPFQINPGFGTIYAGLGLPPIKRIRFHHIESLPIQHPCPTVMCAIRTYGL